MAVNPTTLRLLDGMRISMLAPVDGTSAALIRAWGVAWNELAQEWAEALDDLTAASKDGKWPSRRQVARATKARNALKATRAALDQLARDLPITVTQALPTMTADAAEWARKLAASQYPPQAGSTAQVMTTFDQVPKDAMDAIVRRSTQRITSLSRPLPAQAEQAVRSVLIRGISVGDNPIAAAKLMLERVEDGFYGGRNRALVIARTEMLDAHRTAGQAQEKASADVLAGWQWVAKLDARTCPSCWSKHGNTYETDDPGPLDHQQGRCARVPVTKSWADLGFPGIVEPPSLFPDAQSVFDGLPQEDRLAIMGARRLELLDSGQVSWDDLSKRRKTDGWRDSFAPTPLSDLAA